MHFWDRHKTITGYYESLTSSICDKYDLTQMEYDILMFLHGNPEFNTAADIVKIRKSTKSHVSTSLKSLENKGLPFENAKNKIPAIKSKIKYPASKIASIISGICGLYFLFAIIKTPFFTSDN